ncbi:MAG TPA: hypothetical protein DD473_16010 [Planctomycetaceae bacterium]|nr:hypothetical protein [Planctomycetaceae bacterium]|tara:strand:- start:667 stop:1125 length:459 start_codon:yes stop_codon:yes gene_type:complete
MNLLYILLAASGIAMISYGSRAIKHARNQEFDRAFSCMRSSKLIAFTIAILATMLVLRWPLREKTVSVSEEVSKTVIETVSVPVQVTSWFFFTRTENQLQEVERNVIETVVSAKGVHVFDPWLIIPMLLIALFAAWVQGKFIQYAFARFEID